MEIYPDIKRNVSVTLREEKTTVDTNSNKAEIIIQLEGNDSMSLIFVQHLQHRIEGMQSVLKWGVF